MPKNALILLFVFAFLYSGMWIVLDRFTDSPVPGWDSFITSLSIIATWMLARKLYEHWYLWIVVNAVAVALFLSRGLYPTVVLYGVYFAMSFIGLKEWNKSIKDNISNPLTTKFSKNLRKERKGKS
jgi:nicotinamide mononucleotide transporter